MRFVQLDTLPNGRALVDIDKMTHATRVEGGCRLHLGAEHVEVPHSLDELENVLAGRERGDDGEGSRAGFSMR